MYFHSAALLFIGYLVGCICMYASIREGSPTRVPLSEFALGFFVGWLMILVMPIIKTCRWIGNEWT